MNDAKKKLYWLIGTTLAGFMGLLSGSLLSETRNYLLSVMLVLSAVCIYFLQVFFVTDRNWLDIRAVFSGVWLGTIGLAALRFTQYQKVWLAETWFLVAIAYLMLQVGATVGIKLAPAFCGKVVPGVKKLKVGRLHLKMHPNRLFGICVVTTLIGITCFSINIAIKGFIPAFSDIHAAYVVFYTKFHIFSVAATAVAPLCYYCIATQPLSLIKKIILGLCIFYLVFAFPILVVSRGTFIVAALGLTVCVYYLHGRRLWVLILSVAVMLGCYLFASELRNYTDAQMNYFFQPAKIQIGTVETIVSPETTEGSVAGTETIGDTETIDVTESEAASNTTSAADGTSQTAVRTFSLPPKVAFVYSYLTVSHDNLNEAVMHTTERTMGARQFYPFNVILRIPQIEEKRESVPFRQVTPLLNTGNIIGDFYYDFGGWGVALCTLFWAVVFGLVQGIYDKSKNVFVLFVLGNAMVPVAMCFFSSFLSNFTQWMIWGVYLLLAVATYISLIPRHKKKA